MDAFATRAPSGTQHDAVRTPKLLPVPASAASSSMEDLTLYTLPGDASLLVPRTASRTPAIDFELLSLERFLSSPELVVLDALIDSLPSSLFDLAVVPFLSPADVARLSMVGRCYQLAAKRRVPVLGYGSNETVVLDCAAQFPGGLLEICQFWGQPRRVACGVLHGVMLHGDSVAVWSAHASRSALAWQPSAAPFDVCCGYFSTYVRTVDGCVYALDTVVAGPRLVARHVLAMAAGDGFAAMYTKRGQLVVEGSLPGVDTVRLDDGTCVVPLNALAPSERIVHMAAGARHLVAMTNRGRLLSAGEGAFNQLGRAGPFTELLPMAEPVAAGQAGVPQALAAGERHTMVLYRNGAVRVCGTSSCGELGLDNFSDAPVLTAVRLPAPALGIAAGHRHSLVNVAGHSIYAFGMNTHMQLGVQSSFWSSTLPRPATRPFGAFPRDMAAGSTVSVFCDKQGNMYAVGNPVMCAGACDLGAGVFALAPAA